MVVSYDPSPDATPRGRFPLGSNLTEVSVAEEHSRGPKASGGRLRPLGLAHTIDAVAHDLRETRSPRGASDPLRPHASTPAELKERIALERKGDPFLAYRDQDGALRLVVLNEVHESGRVAIGRRSSSEISLAWDAQVSRLHAELEPIGGDWTISDDGLSQNGTFVNGARLTGKRRLEPGDLIVVGNTALAYCGPPRMSSIQTIEGGANLAVEELTPAERKVLTALCRPYKDAVRFASPAGNQEIAEELVLSIDTVKSHMRSLFRKLGVDGAPQGQKRQLLVERAFHTGLIDERQL
jgi:hypothetical protein